ncbi:hypothetical protein BDW59DRAFT_157987 [Aspergillus cavernicola]|uniref:Uncharacterized protein n=1 Tax=Aspergillus cavernicola TaxID=176166 RepID=A0ABR4IUX1_9EURO
MAQLILGFMIQDLANTGIMDADATSAASSRHEGTDPVSDLEVMRFLGPNTRDDPHTIKAYDFLLHLAHRHYDVAGPWLRFPRETVQETRCADAKAQLTTGLDEGLQFRGQVGGWHGDVVVFCGLVGYTGGEEVAVGDSLFDIQRRLLCREVGGAGENLCHGLHRGGAPGGLRGIKVEGRCSAWRSCLLAGECVGGRYE